MSQLRDLAKPFPDRFVNQNPTGYGSYVAHHIVNQRLLQIVGPFDFALVEIVRGDVDEVKNSDPSKAKPARENAVVGVVARLTVTVDGATHVFEEAGDCEHPQNWPHDGARMKDAMSDAFKRCAMRCGLGLHLWSQRDYYLYDRLKEQAGPTIPGDKGQRVPVPTLDDPLPPLDEPEDAA